MAFLLMLSMLFAEPEVQSSQLPPIQSVEVRKLQVLTQVTFRYDQNLSYEIFVDDKSKPALDKFQKEFTPGTYILHYKKTKHPIVTMNIVKLERVK
jgi:hypothetical protein